MARIDQSSLSGKIRDLPINRELETVLLKAADAAGVDVVFVTSGGQPGTSGKSVGSTRHNGGRAADLKLIANGVTARFSDQECDDIVARFVTAAAANGAIGIGAGVDYMGPKTMHIGFGTSASDTKKIVWGADGKSANAPQWLRDAAQRGWVNPPEWAFRTIVAHVTDEAGEAHASIRMDIPRRFTAEVIKAAQATQRHWGLPASVTLAQWAVESAYGASMPSGSNNPFGIKAREGQPSVLAWTKEEVGGRKISIQQHFRVFPSLDEAFIKHAELLGTSSRYENARRFKNDPDRFADALTGVYATDSNYGTMLKSVMKSNDLYRFNTPMDILVPGDANGWEVRVSQPLQQGSTDTVRVTTLQQRLAALGYVLGAIDGKFGPLTAAALLAFQNDNNLPTTGVLDQTTEDAFQTAQSRRLEDKRIKVTEKDLVADGSRIVIDAGRSRILSWILSGFGALGVGNSAIINAGSGSAARTASNVPDALLPFLADVQRLVPATNTADIARLSGVAKTLSEQLTGPLLPADVVQLVDQLRKVIPADVLSKNPDITKVFDAIGKMTSARPPSFTTIFDILPTFFANDTVVQTAMKGIAAVGGSTLPGFGGSLAVLGIGIAGRYFANRIAAARIEDHQTGANIKR